MTPLYDGNKELIEEARMHFNEPILIGFELCRCVGYAEDDDDCYLVGSVVIQGTCTYRSLLRRQGNVASVCGQLRREAERIDETLWSRFINGIRLRVLSHQHQSVQEERHA
jgi:hypothetical protein